MTALLHASHWHFEVTLDNPLTSTELRKHVFRWACDQVRRAGRPPVPGRFIKACIAMSRTLQPAGMDRATADTVGRSVATYIIAHHKPELARRPPARPGDVRAEERDRILAAYRNEGQDSPSIREIADLLCVSKGKVQRALAEVGISPRREKKLATLSTNARAVVKALDQVFPREGRRIVVIDDLVRACFQASHENFEEVASEITEASISLQVTPTELTHPNSGQPLAVIVRGRKQARSKLERWARDQIHHHQSRRRLGLPPRVSLSFSYYVLCHPVARDLMAVLAIRTWYRDLRVWRDFILASCGGGESARADLKHVAYDLEKIVSIAANFVRLSQAEPSQVLPKMADWVSQSKDRDTAHFVFLQALQLIESDADDYDVLTRWIEETGYHNRIHHLFGRDPYEFEQLRASLNRDDDIVDALLKLESRPTAQPGNLVPELSEAVPGDELDSVDDLDLSIATDDVWESCTLLNVGPSRPFPEDVWTASDGTDDDGTEDDDLRDDNPEGYIFPPEEDD